MSLLIYERRRRPATFCSVIFGHSFIARLPFVLHAPRIVANWCYLLSVLLLQLLGLPQRCLLSLSL